MYWNYAFELVMEGPAVAAFNAAKEKYDRKQKELSRYYSEMRLAAERTANVERAKRLAVHGDRHRAWEETAFLRLEVKYTAKRAEEGYEAAIRSHWDEYEKALNDFQREKGRQYRALKL